MTDAIPAINDRIKAVIMHYSNGVVSAFADLIEGVSQQKLNRLFNIDTRTNKYPLATTDILVAITEKFVEINPAWLLTGVGEMFLPVAGSGVKYTSTPDGNLQNVDVSEPKSAYILTPKTGEILTPTLTPTHKKGVEKQVLVPQYITVDKQGVENILWVNVRASAGYVKGHADREYLETLPSFNLPQLRGKGTYRTFEVDGDSMFPTLENKEAVVGRWVERIEDIVEDYVHVIVSKSLGVLIKRVLNRINEYGYLVLKSDAVDNRNQYPNIEVYPDDILEIWLPVMHLNKKFRHPTDMYKRINNLEADLTEVMRLLKSNKLLPGTTNS